MIPLRLVHRSCSHAFRPTLVCEHCGGAIALHRVEPTHDRVDQPMPQRIVRNRRWCSPTSDSTVPDRDILAVIDERWSVLIVAALMLDASRYDQLTSMLQISSAVLAKRLQRLCALEILINWQDPADARRSFYRLDMSGQDLTRPDTIGWIHTHCGQRVTGHMVCSHCGELLPHQVRRSPAPSDSPR